MEQTRELPHLEDVHVAGVEQVEGAVDVDGARAGGRGDAVGELYGFWVIGF